MDSLLSLKIIWQDEDLIEIRIIASNGRYAGTTEVYTTYDVLEEFVASLAGFPQNIDQKVDFNFGNPSQHTCAGLSFYCWNATGHTAVHVSLEADVGINHRKEEKHNVSLEMGFEAMALDKFLLELQNAIKNKSGTAILKGINPYTQNIG